jgi:predicted NBD/HSP70 family sugar kinase
MRTLKISKENLHAQIVKMIRDGKAESRANLAKMLKVAPSTMSIYVDQLIATGWMREAGLMQGKTGRPKVRLALDGGSGWFAGLEFTASRLQMVSIDFSGKAIDAHVCPIPHGATTETVIQTLQDTLRKATAMIDRPLLGIGVGVPGLVDPIKGTVRYSVIFPGLNDIPLQKTLEQVLEVPVRIENNMRVVAMAERWFGGGRNENDFAILGPRSGFAIAQVRDGKLVTGAHHAVGETGLWPWATPDGERQLHQVLSAPTTWRRLAGKMPDAAIPSDLNDALAELANHDSMAWHEVVNDFARAVGMSHLLIDAGIYYLHGPLVALGTRFCDAISQRALALMPALRDTPVRVVPTTLGDSAGGLGAASLAMEAWDPGLAD